MTHSATPVGSATYRIRAIFAVLIAIVVVATPLGARAQSSWYQAAPIIVANATTDGIIGGFIGALLGQLIGKQILRRSAQRELAAEDELRRRRLTDTDIVMLKMIATSLEEYAVDNGGKYPESLDKLVSPYLNRTPYVPNSDPPVKYIYDNPPLNPKWGLYDLRDNGAFDPTLHKLRNVMDESICTKQTCKYIIYIQSGGVYGMP